MYREAAGRTEETNQGQATKARLDFHVASEWFRLQGGLPSWIPTAISDMAINRRKFRYRAISGVAAGITVRAGMALSFAGNVGARTSMSPDEALKELLAGNRRFATSQLTSVDHELGVLKERTADKQA